MAGNIAIRLTAVGSSTAYVRGLLLSFILDKILVSCKRAFLAANSSNWEPFPLRRWRLRRGSPSPGAAG